MGKLTCPFGCQAETFVVLKGYLKHVQDYHGSHVTLEAAIESMLRSKASGIMFTIITDQQRALQVSIIHTIGLVFFMSSWDSFIQ